MVFFSVTRQVDFFMTNLYEKNIQCTEIEPPTTANRSVICLHGLGADGNDFVPIVNQLQLPTNHGIRFVFPHAPSMPVTINNGYVMRAWYDIITPSLDKQLDEKGIANSVAIVSNIIAREEARGISASNIVVAGFSQGGVMSLCTGLQYPRPIAGIVALSAYLPYPQAALHRLIAYQPNLPIFLGHGQYDPIVPYDLGHNAFIALKNCNFAVSWHSYAIPHSICPEEVSDISLWLQNIFKLID